MPKTQKEPSLKNRHFPTAEKIRKFKIMIEVFLGYFGENLGVGA